MQLAGYLNWVRIERTKDKVSFFNYMILAVCCLRIVQCFLFPPKLSKKNELGVRAK